MKATEPIPVHVALLTLSVVLGVLSGLMGAVFTVVNISVVGRARKAVLSSINSPAWQKLAKMVEVIILVVRLIPMYGRALP